MEGGGGGSMEGTGTEDDMDQKIDSHIESIILCSVESKRHEQTVMCAVISRSTEGSKRHFHCRI
jgi:hypothetical protein